MAEFIKYTRPTGGGSEIVILNVAYISTAVFDQQAGTLRIVTAQGHAETLDGQQAKEALAALNRWAAKS